MKYLEDRGMVGLWCLGVGVAGSIFSGVLIISEGLVGIISLMISVVVGVAGIVLCEQWSKGIIKDIGQIPLSEFKVVSPCKGVKIGFKTIFKEDKEFDREQKKSFNNHDVNYKS